MSQPRSRGRLTLRHLAAPALALALVAGLPLAAGTDEAPPTTEEWNTVSAISVAHGHGKGKSQGKAVKANFLSYNDFHGAIDPPTGSGAAVDGTPAGGVEYLATWLKKLRAEAKSEGRKSVTVGAGDLIGATPLVSAAFHDEPTIELMDEVGLEISSVGNHEFDEGVDELLRLTRGGCHPVDGCADGDGFAGADFTYLAANTVYKDSGKPILPPYEIRKVNGVEVGFVGLTLEGTPDIVNPAGISEVDFLDEVTTANRYARELKARGVEALVLLLHEGGQQNGTVGISDCNNFSGPVKEIVAGLRGEYGLVVSGHTHRYYTCSLPNSAGTQTVVTSAGNNGQLITDVDYSLDRRSGRFTEISARNIVVANGVRNADGSWQRTDSGSFVLNPALVDRKTKRIADKYRAAVAPLANRVVGEITGDIVRDVRANQESPLGDVIADAQLAYTAGAGAQIALMNPGGIRAPLTYDASAGGEAPGQVTYGEAFAVQPFNNLVVTQTFTGAQLAAVLEQQFPGFQGQTNQRVLQVSAGFSYAYDSTAPAGSRVSAMTLNGVAIDPAATYRVTTNDFLANGGDGFTTLTAGTERVYAPGFDLDALVAYLGAGTPIAPGPADRIVRLG